MVSLRCKFCGAPFEVDSLTSDTAYITCTSCGTSQTRVDAKQYLEQMMGQVKSWISKAIPMGVNISQSDNVDAVARHNIFHNSVKPAIETEMTEYRFGFLSLLSNQLVMLPNRTNTVFRSAHRTESAFEFNAKAKAVSPLAIDADGVELVQTADKLSLAYAMMLNNMKQLAENKPGRYTLMANNFEEAAESLKGLQKYEVVYERFDALALICKGIAYLEEGNTIEARVCIQEGSDKLEAAKQKTMTSLEFGSTYIAVDQETLVAKVIMKIVETALYDPSTNALKALDILRRIMDSATEMYKSNIPEAGMFKSVNRYNEIFESVLAIFESKAGKGPGIPITAGGGSVLMPFWAVITKYTFVTGSLLSKKSVEVSETLLVPATFTTTSEAFSNPRSFITDVFASKPGGFLDSLKGKETSMSQSGEIGNIIRSASVNSIGSRDVVVPVSTKSEAEAFVTKYFRQCSNLKQINPKVENLIYVPCELSGSGGISFPMLGKFAPRSIGNTAQVRNLLIQA